MIKNSELNLGQIEAIVNKLGGMEGVKRFLAGTVEIVMKSILELVNSEIKVSARERFVVADHFKKGNAGIYYIGDNFKTWFGEKVETNVLVATLTSHRLTQNSVDGPIKAELGEGHETFLTWLFEKIETQSDGREGELLVNGYANIFYIDGRVVDAHWSAGDGWVVSAYGITDPDEWYADLRVFSRNSVLKSSDTPASA
jgi:hypothetical protein